MITHGILAIDGISDELTLEIKFMSDNIAQKKNQKKTKVFVDFNICQEIYKERWN